MSSADASVVRLQALDTCAVSDALDRLGLSGTVVGIHRVSTERRIAGRVVPVKLGPAGEGVASRHLCSAAIEAATSEDVIVVEHHSREDAAWNEPIVVGGVDLKPGDLVIADGSGVVFIDANRSAEVLELAESIAAREAKLTAAVRKGTPVSRVMDGSYESMLKQHRSSE